MTHGTEIPTLNDIEDSKKAMDDIQSFTYPTSLSFIDSKNVSRTTIKALEANYIQTAINDGIWAVGISFTAYNQYMVFGGTAYKPKNTTTLPYVSEVTPNVTFVEPVDTATSIFNRLNPSTMAAWQNDLSVQIGDVAETKERTSGKGGGAKGNVISGILTVNGREIVQHNILLLSWVLKIRDLVYPDELGAIEGGVIDASAEITASFLDFNNGAKVKAGTWLMNSAISNALGAAKARSLSGANISATKLQTGTDTNSIISLTELDLDIGKNFFLTFSDMLLNGRETSTVPLILLGTSDFNTFNRMILQDNQGGGIEINGSFAGATTFNEFYVFNVGGFGINISSRIIADIDLFNCRVEADTSFDFSTNGVLINNSPRGHAKKSQYSYATARIHYCQFERLTGLSIYVKQGGAVSIKDSQIGKTSILLGNRSFDCTVKDNDFVDENSSLIDSGYNNDVTNNKHLRGAGLPVFSGDKGYNSLMINAEFIKANGTDGWTFSSTDVRRVQGATYAKAKTNSIKLTLNGTATIDLAVSADTFYVLRHAFNCEASTTATPDGGKIRILDKTNGNAVLFDSGNLMDADLEHGNMSLESAGFKTAGTTADITIELSSVSNETIFFHLVDIAENVTQDNPTLEDTWVGGLPTVNWAVSGDMSVTEYTADFHSGSSSLRLQAPAIIAGTSELVINSLGLSNSQSYEIGFWIKDLAPENGTSILFSTISFVQAIFGIGGLISYTEGLEDWVKITYQVTSNSQDADGLILARRAVTTYRRALDLLFDDVYVIPIADS